MPELICQRFAMSDPSHITHRTEVRGIEFLEQLESRHDQVLNELELLNERVESVLKMYTQGRSGEGNSSPPTTP